MTTLERISLCRSDLTLVSLEKSCVSAAMDMCDSH